jgi:transglutaminase-like putative cysteine protease
MPYKLGIDPNSVPSGTKKINSYNDIITAVLNSPLGPADIPIAITNKNLDVNTMQMVLSAQCGYGYIVYQFNADATAITSQSSPAGLPGAPTGLNDCITRINRLKDSVSQILARIITPSMTNDQKFTAIYNYITPTQYDFNYNTPNMVFDSQTAFGVFVNKKAVCGGYSWAVNMLANAAGIQCYNVGGYGNNVAHAWTRANYNGGYYYFDATWDHSYINNTYQYFSLTEAGLLQKNHVWNNTMINALVAEK